MIKQKIFIYILSIIFLPLFAFADILETETNKPLPDLKVPKITYEDLNSQTRFFSIVDKTYPIFKVKVLIKAGAVNDGVDKVGLSDITARLAVIGGSGKYSPEKFEETTENMAISISASSGREETEFVMVALGEDFKKAFELLLDTIFSPKFDEKRFDILRENMKAEVQREDDDPENVASKKIRNLVFGEDNPYGWFPSEASLSNVEHSDILTFHDSYYHPKNMWFGISGDFDEKEAIKILNKKIKKFKNSSFVNLTEVKVGEQRKPKKVVEIKPTTYAYLRMGMPGLDRFNPEKYSAILGNEILGGSSLNNMLMQEVRVKKGLVYSIGSRFSFDLSDGMFLVYAATKMNKTDNVIKSVKDNMSVLRRQFVSDDKIFQAKRSMLGAQLFTLSQPFSVISSAVGNDFYGYPRDYWFIYRDGIKNVTKEQIKSFFEKNLNENDFNVVIVKGEEK